MELTQYNIVLLYREVCPLSDKQKQSLFNGAAILLFTTAIVKVLGAIYKIPLNNIFTMSGRGYFQSAYAIYFPVYTIALAGLPRAVSRLISENMTLGRYRDVRKIRKVASRIFWITGILGTVVLLILAYPYSKAVAKADVEGYIYRLPSIIVIAPCILFSCIMSTYRGYYEGMRNMIPTGVSQVIEALGKVVFGLILAKFAVDYGINQYNSGNEVIFWQQAYNSRFSPGTPFDQNVLAQSIVYSMASAAAIVGILLGSILAYFYLAARYRIRGDAITKEMYDLAPKADNSKALTKTLISIAIPMVLGALVTSVSSLVDSLTIQTRLGHAVETGHSILVNIYGGIIKNEVLQNTGEFTNYLWGTYSAMSDFRNLVPTLTQSIGITALPAIAAAWVIKDSKKIKRTIEDVIRMVLLIALPAGLGMSVLSKPILHAIYPKDVEIAAPMLMISGISVAFVCLSATMTSVLQGIGRADIPVKSMIAGIIVKVVMNFILIGNPSVNIQGAPYSTLAMYLVICVINMYCLLTITKTKINALQTFLKPLISAVLSSLTAWAVYRLILSFIPFGGESFSFIQGSERIYNVFILALCVISAVIVYIVALFLLKAVTKEDLSFLTRKKKNNQKT